MAKISTEHNNAFGETRWIISISDDELRGAIVSSPRMKELLMKTAEMNSAQPSVVLTALASLLREMEEHM